MWARDRSYRSRFPNLFFVYWITLKASTWKKKIHRTIQRQKAKCLFPYRPKLDCSRCASHHMAVSYWQHGGVQPHTAPSTTAYGMLRIQHNVAVKPDIYFLSMRSHDKFWALLTNFKSGSMVCNGALLGHHNIIQHLWVACTKQFWTVQYKTLLAIDILWANDYGATLEQFWTVKNDK